MIETPPGFRKVELTVSLSVSEHFKLRSNPRVKPLAIDRDADRSEEVVFGVEVIGTPAASDLPPAITAFFAYKGRGCGCVSRRIQIKGGAPTRKPRAMRLPRGALEVDFGAREPDLVVSITASSLDKDNRFTCTVSTRHLDEYRQGESDEWQLPKSAGSLVAEYMSDFTDEDITEPQRANRLLGAGVELFKASPSLFQKVYWTLVDEEKPLRTIFILSQEPYITWELMVPTRSGKDGDEPLGVAYTLGRWITLDQVSPPQKLSLTDSFVVAPTYRTAQNLTHAPAEAELVCRLFRGRSVLPATWSGLNHAFGAGGASLLHFVCHGGDDGRSILLAAEKGKARDSKLKPLDLERWPAAENPFASGARSSSSTRVKSAGRARR